MSSFEDGVHAILAAFPQNTTYLIAVSGGADSMALLASLYSKDSNGLNVLHVDHGLRGQESKDDAEFVCTFCEERKIPCTVVSIPEGEVLAYSKSHRAGIEAAARHFRRGALLDKARQLDTPENKTLILTAHTKDDTIELSLMRIFRGAGPAGLASMPIKKDRFVRPLLGVTRAEVIGYLKEKNIPWREDSTNTDDKFLRNKIRCQIIPFLDEMFKTSRRGAETQSEFSWKKGIVGMAETQSLVAEFLDAEVKNRIVWDQGVDGSLTTEEKSFFAQPQIIKEESIFQAINLLSSLRPQHLSASARGLKRYVVRQFCQGKTKACDLSIARITRKKGRIILASAIGRVTI